MNPQVYSAVLIGAGQIGCPIASQVSQRPDTHAGAYHRHERFKLAALVDPSAEAQQKAQSLELAYADSIVSLPENPGPEIISICTPAACRPDILRSVLERKPLAVIAEKPLSLSGLESSDIVREFKAAGIPLWVNLSRRFVPQYQRLAERFARDEQVISASIKYAKGLRHNGVHVVDLARLLFGDITQSLFLGLRRDYSEIDPTVSFFLELENCPQFIAQGLDDSRYTHFELDIFTEDRRYLIDQDHTRLTVYERLARPNSQQGYRLQTADTQVIEHEHALVSLLDNVIDVLEHDAEQLSPGANAAEVESWIDEFFEQAIS